MGAPPCQPAAIVGCSCELCSHQSPGAQMSHLGVRGLDSLSEQRARQWNERKDIVPLLCHPLRAKSPHLGGGTNHCGVQWWAGTWIFGFVCLFV